MGRGYKNSSEHNEENLNALNKLLTEMWSQRRASEGSEKGSDICITNIYSVLQMSSTVQSFSHLALIITLSSTHDHTHLVLIILVVIQLGEVLAEG